MKKLYTALSISFMLACTSLSHATTHIITQEALTFNPAALSVMVGDIIEWHWTGGTHTTTSLIIPVGAATWDSPLTTDNQVFSYTVTVMGQYTYKCTPHFEMGMGGAFQATPVSVEPVAYAPADFTAGLDENNNLQVTISGYANAQTTLRMFDLSGKLAGVLVNEILAPGTHRYTFGTTEMRAGIYFLRMEQSGKVVTRKVLVN